MLIYCGGENRNIFQESEKIKHFPTVEGKNALKREIFSWAHETANCQLWTMIGGRGASRLHTIALTWRQNHLLRGHIFLLCDQIWKIIWTVFQCRARGAWGGWTPFWFRQIVFFSHFSIPSNIPLPLVKDQSPLKHWAGCATLLLSVNQTFVWFWHSNIEFRNRTPPQIPTFSPSVLR